MPDRVSRQPRWGLVLETGRWFFDFESRPVNHKLMVKRAYRGKYIFSLLLVLWPNKSRRLRTACYGGHFEMSLRN